MLQSGFSASTVSSLRSLVRRTNAARKQRAIVAVVPPVTTNMGAASCVRVFYDVRRAQIEYSSSPVV